MRLLRTFRLLRSFRVLRLVFGSSLSEIEAQVLEVRTKLASLQATYGRLRSDYQVSRK